MCFCVVSAFLLRFRFSFLFFFLFLFFLSFFLLERDDYEPSHRKYMLQCARHNEWMEGERDELRSINKCGVWTKQDPPPGTKVIPLKWVYKVKKNPDGTIARYKCRLVAQGFYQVFGEDYFQTYSPVAKFTSIRTVLALSAQIGLTVRQMDVDTAFLIADISENIWFKYQKELLCQMGIMDCTNCGSHYMG